MQNCPIYVRCLICRRATLKNSPIDSQKLGSNASLLQDFLNCFHTNVLDSQLNDLPTSTQFCPTCKQFIAEWSSIQDQMTQLTRRAAQLEATLSALLLSAPQIQKQNHQDVTEIINKRNQNAQEVQRPLLHKRTVDDIRSKLQKKYSIRVMLDNIPLPSASALNLEPVDNGNDVDETWDHWESEQLPVQVKLDEPLLGDNVNDDEWWDHWLLGVCNDEQCLPSKDELEDKETSEQTLVLGTEREEEANCDGSNSQHAPPDSKETDVKAGNVNANPCPRNREKEPSAIRVEPNIFTYNGYDVIMKDEDQCYYCGVCNFKGGRNITSILGHIRFFHYTAEDKMKFTAVKTSDTEWLVGGKYKIVKEDGKFNCEACGCGKTRLDKLVRHIRSKHIECPDQAPSKKIQCEICGIRFVSEGSYQRHIRFHQTGTMKCPTCDKQFLGQRSFKRHMKVHELGDKKKKRKCETCGKSFLSLKDYKDHERLHIGQKPLKGQVRGYLTRHRKSAHEIQPKSRRVMKVSK